MGSSHLNLNKTDEMDISLASNTIFLRQKKDHLFCISKRCDSCGDQVVTDRQTDRHTHTHWETTITLHLHD